MATVINKAKKLREAHARQNGVCALCGTGLSLRAEGDLAATVDHIIPVSKGGTGAASNLRAAHKLCNRLRGNDEGDVMIDLVGLRVMRAEPVLNTSLRDAIERFYAEGRPIHARGRHGVV